MRPIPGHCGASARPGELRLGVSDVVPPCFAAPPGLTDCRHTMQRWSEAGRGRAFNQAAVSLSLSLSLSPFSPSSHLLPLSQSSLYLMFMSHPLPSCVLQCEPFPLPIPSFRSLPSVSALAILLPATVSDVVARRALFEPEASLAKSIEPVSASASRIQEVRLGQSRHQYTTTCRPFGAHLRCWGRPEMVFAKGQVKVYLQLASSG